jgi:hypothetical protein
MNKPLVCFGIGIGMLILGVRTYLCCILTLGSPFPRRHGLRISPPALPPFSRVEF